MKKRTVLSSIPEVFSLKPSGGYGRFVPREGAAGMMRDQWAAIGQRLTRASDTVGTDSRVQAQKTEAA